MYKNTIVELSQKVKRGIAISASKCKFFGGAVPLGYKIDTEKNFIVDEETAPIVQKIFEMFVGGTNYRDIARYLNERGIKTSPSGTWGKSSCHTIVKNRKYIGKYAYMGKEVDGGVPRIISDELFAEAQVVLARLAQAPSRGKAKVDYLLSQKMLCGKCGNNFTGMSAASRDKSMHYYYAWVLLNALIWS